MPLYEYECQACSTRIEKIQKFSDPPLATCAQCGGRLERLVSSPALQFKGSGWYVTDYARQSAPADSRKTESASGETAKKESETPTKTESGKTKSPAD